ncbi:MAG: DUF3048 C-terminal domain-containing protein [Caldilineaceae bacterium]|nr:DUF3048 C-terminal domain-containing protein [Caldilineaceae bacterium]
MRPSAAGLVLLVLLSLSGCTGPDGASTPTPTKTPEAAGVQPAEETATPPPASAAEGSNTTAEGEKATETPVPGSAARYTGLPLADPSLLQETPVLVCINNDITSRSAHYGLNEADVTYEFIVDGYHLTRLTSLYQSIPAREIGPVRSARWPNIHTTYMFDGILACSGGSDGIRYLLKNEVGFPYLDADSEDPESVTYFYSVGNNYRTRLRTSVDRVRRWMIDMAKTCEVSPLLPYCLEVFSPWLEGQKRNPRPVERARFHFSDTPKEFWSGEATAIRIPYPENNGVEWRYDAASGRYLRYQSGAVHMDQATGQQISSENVIVVFAEHELTNIVEDSLGTLSVKINLYGFGDLRVFRDGKVYEGTWRANDQSPPRWLGPGEQPITLKPGRTWIQVVRTSDRISFQ